MEIADNLSKKRKWTSKFHLTNITVILIVVKLEYWIFNENKLLKKYLFKLNLK